MVYYILVEINAVLKNAELQWRQERAPDEHIVKSKHFKYNERKNTRLTVTSCPALLILEMQDVFKQQEIYQLTLLCSTKPKNFPKMSNASTVTLKLSRPCPKILLYFSHIKFQCYRNSVNR